MTWFRYPDPDYVKQLEREVFKLKKALQYCRSTVVKTSLTDEEKKHDIKQIVDLVL